MGIMVIINFLLKIVNYNHDTQSNGHNKEPLFDSNLQPNLT